MLGEATFVMADDDSPNRDAPGAASAKRSSESILARLLGASIPRGDATVEPEQLSTSNDQEPHRELPKQKATKRPLKNSARLILTSRHIAPRVARRNPDALVELQYAADKAA